MPSKKEILSLDPDREKQVEFFESFLDAVQNGYQVSFAHTRTGLRMKLTGFPDRFPEDRLERIKLLHRTIVILKSGQGTLVAEKGSGDFYFWVGSDVKEGLPPHKWSSRGFLIDPTNFGRDEPEEYGLAPITLQLSRP